MADKEEPFRIQELVGFGPLPPDQPSLAPRWAEAAAYAATLPTCDIAPQMTALPAELADLGAALADSQGFRDVFGDAPADVRMVSLDQLVVFQPFIVLNHAAALAQRLKSVADLPGLFRFCMDPPSPAPARGYFDRANMTCTLVSEGFEYTVVDFRNVVPGGIRLTGPEEQPLKEYAASHLLISLGVPPNYLAACLVGKRLLLRNGSHRAYALFKEGRREVPCVVQTVTNRAFLEQHGFSKDWIAVCLDAPRPPLLRDYFDENLTVPLTREPYRRIIQVRITSELRPMTEKSTTRVFWRA
jgi:hypothetical protein